MMQPHETPVADRRGSPGNSFRLPPEEKFWQRYSPHHEAPLSSVVSLAVHALIVALVLLGGYWLSKLGSTADRPPAVATVVVPDLPPLLPGEGAPSARRGNDTNGPRTEEAVREQVPPRAQEPERGVPASRSPLPAPVLPPRQGVIVPEFEADPYVQKLLDRGVEAAIVLQQTGDSLRKPLLDGIGHPGPAGPGSGALNKPGDNQGPSERVKRVLRWSMVFSTANGGDYARQLQGLGAYLAIPNPDRPTEFRVIRDLSKRPVQGKVEDVSKIQRIFWIDDKPQSVGSLATALGMKPVPPRIVAFFPEELEQKLLKLEHDYRGLAEADVAETRFEVRLTKAGKYEPVVVSQAELRR
jgi:hypothetical protein